MARVCGIAGIVGTGLGSTERATALVESMVGTLTHRGPDGSGVVAVSPNCVLGHRRLAVIDRSDAGHQPMVSRSGRWIVTFNGEIYNHRQIRTDLSAEGAHFRGHSDTETLVEAIDAWGVDATLQRTNGMLALAAFDAVDDRLVIARDRFGEKPLYWWHREGRLAFASELRALRQLPDVDFELDDASVTALLRWSFVPHPHTIYRDVLQLAPGSLLDIAVHADGHEVTERRWWSLEDTVVGAVGDRTDTTPTRAADELEALLADAVALRMESDVPLGAFLSGGIDSSVVAALAQRASGHRSLVTFTVSMPDIGFDESDHARAVATHLDTDHHQLHLSASDAFERIPQLPHVWDEPFGDPSMLPNLLLCSAASDGLTVCLGGDGGDEFFAGYNRHVLGSAVERRTARLPEFARRGLARLALSVPPTVVDGAARFVPGLRRIPNPGDKAQKFAALMAADRGDGSTWEALAGVWPVDALTPTPHRPFSPDPGIELDAVERMMLADTSSVLCDQMLVKTDRASMAASLEVRAPFLDHRVLEWAWRQPTSVKVAGGVGKQVPRDVAERLVPASIATRPKMGFDPPLGAWLRTDLRTWAEDLLAKPTCVERGWISGDVVATAWSDHLRGRRNRDDRLWSVLMLESWLAAHGH
ncbi:MAG: asparagine synthase (glutamine-hydrolyzing) [Ilumatobacter sp.]|uniref:asparagine synthase (glutamine-hydrolyzing) n=1 Tax=Ilumatobacter sp. TaxID=1967498 RepID=UPI00329A3FA5